MISLVFVIAFYTNEPNLNNNQFLPSWLLGQRTLYLFMLFIFFLAFKNWLGLLALKLQNQFVYKVSLRISRENLQAYINESYEKYIKTDTSIPSRKIMHQPLEFCQYVLSGSQQLITEIILLILVISVVIFYKASLFLALFLILTPLILLISYILKRKLQLVRKHIKSSSERASQNLREALAGFVEVNLYQRQSFFIDRFCREQEKITKYMPDLQVSQSISSRLMEVFAVIGLFLLFLTNQYIGNQQSGIIINIGAFTAAAYKIIPGIIKVINLKEQIKTFGFSTVDLNCTSTSQLPDNQLFIKSIEFSKVCYTYHKNMVLDNYTANFQLGDFVGISGSSGVGKSTLVNVLLGFLQEQQGTIYINKMPLSADERRNYWSKIAYVKQQPFLIHDTILSNIILDYPPYDSERLSQAIEASGLHNVINEFPEGLDKVIVENGKNVSGGQRQRIALARAFYKDSDLIILDEPCSELDEDSEIQILKHLQKLAEAGKIIILITHNKKNLDFCNKVVSMSIAF